MLNASTLKSYQSNLCIQKGTLAVFLYSYRHYTAFLCISYNELLCAFSVCDYYDQETGHTAGAVTLKYAILT